MIGVILAGGVGRRLQPYTSLLPKPMLPIQNKPILEHLISWLKKYDICTVLLCVSYMHETIKKYFGNGNRFGINIKYVTSRKPLLTAGQLSTAKKFIDDKFLCIYSDVLYNFNLQNMISQHNTKNSFTTIAIHKYKFNFDYGVINTNKMGRVTSWIEKPIITKNIHIGCMIFEKDIFNFIPDELCEINTVINNLLSHNKQVDSFVVRNKFYDIGNTKQYEYISKIFT